MHSDEKDEFRKEALKCFEKHQDKERPDLLPNNKLRFVLRGKSIHNLPELLDDAISLSILCH